MHARPTSNPVVPLFATSLRPLAVQSACLPACRPMQDDEQLFIFAVVRGLRLSRILEIGGLRGDSALNFLKARCRRGCRPCWCRPEAAVFCCARLASVLHLTQNPSSNGCFPHQLALTLPVSGNGQDRRHCLHRLVVLLALHGSGQREKEAAAMAVLTLVSADTAIACQPVSCAVDVNPVAQQHPTRHKTVIKDARLVTAEDVDNMVGQ